MVARAVLSRMVETDGAFEIAAVAGTAEDAIDALQHVHVDVILLDLEMPGAGGLQTLPRIIEAARGARVMIVSSLAEDGAEETIAALAMGAADTLAQARHGPLQRPLFGNPGRQAARLGPCRTQGPRVPEPLRQRFESPLRAMSPDPVELLAIGASTGGIHALGCLFQALPPKIGIPILVTQHLPAPFMTVFARQLGVAAKREAVVAEDGMALASRPYRHRSRRRPSQGRPRPADSSSPGSIASARRADACLRSIRCSRRRRPCSAPRRWASCLPAWAATGSRGRRALVACGGSVMAQDEASCAV